MDVLKTPSFIVLKMSFVRYECVKNVFCVRYERTVEYLKTACACKEDYAQTQKFLTKSIHVTFMMVVEGVQEQNHCDGVLSNDWNTLLGQQISQHTAMSMSRSALGVLCKLKLNT